MTRSARSSRRSVPSQVVRAVVEKGEAPRSSGPPWSPSTGPALAVPEEFGGIGLTFVETAVVAEELGRAVAPGAAAPTVTQFAPIVREVGDARAAAALPLRRRLRRDHRHRGAGRPSRGLVPRRRHHGGRAGRGRLGPRRHQARCARIRRGDGEVAVVARAGDGFGVFVVPAAQAGLAAVRSLDASRPLATATLHRVTVGDDRALGEPGSAASTRGHPPRPSGGDRRPGARDRGDRDALFQLVLAYVKDRKQFGVAVGSFQASSTR